MVAKQRANAAKTAACWLRRSWKAAARRFVTRLLLGDHQAALQPVDCCPRPHRRPPPKRTSMRKHLRRYALGALAVGAVAGASAIALPGVTADWTPTKV